MPYTQDQRQALNEAKSRIARALTDAGVRSMYCDTIKTLRTRSLRVFGRALAGETSTEYFNRVSCMVPRTKAATSGQVVPPQTHEPLRAKPWKPRPHLRAAEIDSLPSLIPAAGAGNKPSLGGREARD